MLTIFLTAIVRRSTIAVIFLTGFSAAFGQNLRVFYRYDYVKDTVTRNHQTALMRLDLQHNTSEFYSLLQYKEDSIKNIMVQNGQNASMPDDKANEITYRITKHQNEIIYRNIELSIGRVVVKDNRAIKWKLTPEASTIAGYPVQRAETTFAGRRWIAWFTPEIPISEGPYKFRGLPGLILEIGDDGNNHVFRFSGIEKLENKFAYPKIPMKETSMSAAEYKKTWQAYRKDPAASIRLSYLAGRIPNQRDHKGNYLTGLQVVQRIEKTLKAKVQANNNPLELDLFE